VVLPADRWYGMRQPIRTFDEFRDAVSAYRLPRVIIAALELKLFTVIGRATWFLPDLARELKVSERGLSILCRNLAMTGLLHKSGNHYRNSRLAATALNGDDPAFRGSYLDLITNHWTDWLRLPDAVRTGEPLDKDEPDEPAYRRRFTWAMHYRTVETAPMIAAQLHLKGARTLLDLGGGPGTYAMAFLAKNPGLRATVCDRPAALEVAREIAATHKAGARVSYLPLDLLTDDIPGSFDVIWYSNVLHIYSPDQNLDVFRRAKAALTEGGRFIIQDAFLHDREGLFPEDASLFAVSMLLFTKSGNTYSVRETTAWLKEAGFDSIKPVRMKRGKEDWEGGILEAAVRRKPSKKPGHRGRSTRRLRSR
jgi:SAM-dependent methyltransferase